MSPVGGTMSVSLNGRRALPLPSAHSSVGRGAKLQSLQALQNQPAYQ
jgi:hypothetical protein